MMNSFKPVSPHINFCFGFLLWITRGLIGRNVKFHFLSRKTNCSSEGPGFDWSINGSLAFAFASSDDFSCLRDPENPLAFIFFLHRLRFFFQSFSTKGILYLTRSMIWYIQQTYSYSNVSHNWTICFCVHVVVTEISGMNSVTYDLFREGNELVTEGKLKMTTIVAMAMR